MSTGTALAVAVALLIGNAFFVGAEFAIISARRSAIEPLAAAGSRRAQTVLWAMEHVSLMLAVAQLGVTVCSTGLGMVAEPAIAHALYAPFQAWGLGEAATHTVAFLIALFIVVYLHVVFGEMVPKNLAVSGPDQAVMWFGPPLVVIGRAFSPIIRSLNWLANHIIRLFGIEPKDEVASAFTAEEVQSIVERSQAEGLLNDTSGLLTEAIEFSDHTAAEVMVPIAEVVTVAAGSTAAEVETVINETGFSRLGVTLDGVLVGYLHLKDVLYADAASRGLAVEPRLIRRLAQVSGDAEVEDVLGAMQQTGAHLALVSENGSSVGVVFLEDILEELVGEVRDAMQRRARRR